MADIHSFEPIFGSWYVDGLLGKGSYGSVYKATRSEYGNTFFSAIKHISIEDTPDISAEQQARALSREINFNYQLRGESHFVSYEDSMFLNKPDGNGVDVFIRMELLTSLVQYMKQIPLTESDVLHLGMDISLALDSLEHRKIIHRDIKPENIFINDQGSFKLGDFGVARSLGATTSGMTVAGTFNYMAPEIYRGSTANHTLDIYSLGMVLYRLLNGNRAPFLPLPPASPSYEDANAALSRRMNGEPLQPPAYASPEFAKVILRACAYEPQRRWQTARDFYNAMQALSETEASLTPNLHEASQDRSAIAHNYRTAMGHAAFEAYTRTNDQTELEYPYTGGEKKSNRRLVPILAGSVAAVLALGVFTGSLLAGQNKKTAEPSLTPESFRQAEKTSPETNELQEESERSAETAVPFQTQEPRLTASYYFGDLSVYRQIYFYWAAASTEIEDQGVTYYAGYAIDGDMMTSWQEDSDGTGAGENITTFFDGPETVELLGLWLGSSTGYEENNRPKKLLIEFSDGSSFIYDCADINTMVYLGLSRPVTTTFIKFTILDVYAGSVWSDTCITEIAAYHHI